jgi:hypothetical protein
METKLTSKQKVRKVYPCAVAQENDCGGYNIYDCKESFEGPPRLIGSAVGHEEFGWDDAVLRLPVPQESEGVAESNMTQQEAVDWLTALVEEHPYASIPAQTALQFLKKSLAHPSLVETAEESFIRGQFVMRNKAVEWDISLGGSGEDLMDMDFEPYTPPSSPKPSSEDK